MDIVNVNPEKRFGFANAPMDILREIFEYLFATCRYLEKPVQTGLQAWTHRDKAIVSTHICQHWRSVALDIPTLWSCIVLPAFSREQTEQYLSRSKEASLTIYIVGWENHPFAQEPLDEIVPLIEPHLDRIKEWRAFGAAVNNPLTSKYLKQAQNVEDLAFNYMKQNNINIILANVSVASDFQLPKLRKLSLGYITPSASLPWFKDLAILSLHMSSPTPQMLSIILNQCSKLEQLLLSKMELLSMNASIFEVTKPNPVHLPHLREMRLNLLKPNADCEIRLLDYFVSQPRDLLHISTVIGDEEIPNFMLIKNIPNAGHYRILRISISDDNILIEILVESDTAGQSVGPANISWQIRSKGILRSAATLRVLFENIALFSDSIFSKIITMEILFLAEGMITADESDYRILLDRLPSVEKIIFRACASAYDDSHLQCYIAKALYCFNDSLKDNGAGLGVSFSSTIRVLHFDGFAFWHSVDPICIQVSFFASLKETLVRRLSSGYRLPVLQISNAQGLSRRAIDDLRSLADEVVVLSTSQSVAPPFDAINISSRRPWIIHHIP